MRQNIQKLLTIAWLLVSINTVAAHDFKVGGIYYYITNKTDKTVKVTYVGNYPDPYLDEYTGSVVIPSSVTHSGTTYSVTSIGTSAFSLCNGLTSVTIPNSVTSIGNSAFYGCNGLTSATIPNSVTAIGDDAFHGCYGLTSVTIPNSVTSIGNSTFSDCDGLTSVTIPESVTEIGYNAFLDCDGLTSVTIPNSVTSIGNWAFYGCNGLTTVNFNATNCTEMGSYNYPAFDGCTNLATLNIGEIVTNIPGYAFSRCTGLTSVTIPNSVTSIGKYAFYECINLKLVINLSNLTFSKGSIDCGYVAYYASHVIDDSNLSVVEDFVFYKDNNVNILAIYLGNATTIVLPADFNGENYVIGESAFWNCTSLTSVTIPNSVTSIGNSAFNNCFRLAELIIEDGKETLSLGCNYYNYSYKGEGLFYDCPLEKLYLGRNLDYNTDMNYGYSPFYYKKIKSVTFGSAIISINKNLMSTPIKIIWLTNTPPTGYKYAEGIMNYVSNDLYTELADKIVYPYLSSTFEVDGVRYVPVSPSERTCDAIDCVYDTTATDININNTVSYKGISMTLKKIKPYTCYDNDFIRNINIDFNDTIPKYAFYGCDSVTEAIIKANVISGYAFSNCATISPASITVEADSIGICAFDNCSAIKTIVLDVDTIGTDAFNGCSAIESATISADKIESSAFYNCKNLELITLDSNLKYIGSKTFYNCSALNSIIIPDSVATLGASAFYGCSTLKSVKIGTGVQAIKDYTFYDCKSLPSINIPSNVSFIGNYVFGGCTSLSDVTIADRETELSLGSNGSNPLFVDCPLKTVYIGGNITYPTSRSWGYSPFYRNTSLETVKIADKETEISENEFYGCTGLKNISMGDGVETIGNWAFSGCSSLDYFEFGSGMKSIGDEAFSDCTAMTKLVSNASVPPTCGTQALDDINKWTCELYIPGASMSAYQAADQWKEFFFMIDGVEDIKINKTEAIEIARYDIYGRQLTEPTKGINIIKMSDGRTRKEYVK